MEDIMLTTYLWEVSEVIPSLQIAELRPALASWLVQGYTGNVKQSMEIRIPQQPSFHLGIKKEIPSSNNDGAQPNCEHFARKC